MSQFYVPGPAYIQVGLGVSNALVHLGWSESGVRVDFGGEHEDVLCDIAGSRIGMDAIYQGQDARITCELNFYNEAVLVSVLARLKGGTAGTIANQDIGSLMITEGYAYRLLVVAPYASKTAYSATMIPAMNFVSAYLEGSAEILHGTKVKKPRLTFRAIPTWTVTGGSASAILWNEVSTGQAPVQ